ncbi:MAG TPA: polymer-forming cytoskeletal protein, partial [Polyangiales bacterium]|nr:polymer-forming cytoskeletal protein [Polyangiales bacterium]
MSNRSPSGEQKQTTVEEGTEFKGTLSSTCPVVVRGVLDGDIKAPSLSIASTGTVVGNVRAQRIQSEGVLAGNVDADEVSLSGSVRSNTVIRARTLEVKLERDKGKLEVTFGECILEVGDEPGIKASKEPASARESRKPATASEQGAASGDGSDASEN